MDERRIRTFDHPLKQRLVDRFTERVLVSGDLPQARKGDVRSALEFWLANEGATLGVTCTITGSSYEASWDGSEAGALALVDEAAAGTAHLVTATPHYAWLRSRR